MEERQYKVEIKNRVRNVKGKYYTAEGIMKERFQMFMYGIASGALSVAVLAGAAYGTKTLIQYIKDRANNVSTQTAIENANLLDDYLDTLTEQREVNELQELSEAINTYYSLKNMKDRDNKQQAEFYQACDTIVRLEGTAIDMYRDNLCAMIAEAMNMNKEDVKVECYIHDGSNGRDYSPMIILDGGRKTITERSVFNQGMDGKLAEAIKRTADAMLTTDEDKKLEYALDFYNKGLRLPEEYNISANGDNISISKIKDKPAEQSDRNENNTADDYER